ncbi:unnamed protein product, partial [Rotaria sp. Silwood1]
KILIDHTKQTNSNFILSPSSLCLPPPTSIPPPPPLLIQSSLNESKDNDSLTNDITDDGNISDSSMSGNHEIIADEGPAPLTCERGEDNNDDCNKFE